MASKVTVNKTKLLEIIDEFLEPYRQEGVNGAEPVAVPTEAAEYIANGSGRTPDVAARTLHRIIRENPKYVRFGTVDWLVAAGMGRPDLLHTDLVTTKRVSQSVSAQLPKRQKRPSVPEGVPAKKCPGRLCKGQFLPLSSEFWNFHKTGKEAGKPRRYCRKCDSFQAGQYRKKRRARDPEGYRKLRQAEQIRKRKHKDWQYCGLVPASRVMFAVDELCRVFGPGEAARRIGIHQATIFEWRRRKFSRMQQEYAARVLLALQEARNGNSFQKT